MCIRDSNKLNRIEESKDQSDQEKVSSDGDTDKFKQKRLKNTVKMLKYHSRKRRDFK